MTRVAFWVSVALSALTLLGGAVWASSSSLAPGTAAPGVTVAGRLSGAANPLESVVQELARRLQEEPVSFASSTEAGATGAALSTTFGELGITIDTGATLRRALSIGRRGSPLTRWRELAQARQVGVDVPLALELDREVLLARLGVLKAHWDRAPRSARYDAGAAALVSHASGRYLDLERAADDVWSAALGRAGRLGSGSGGVPRRPIDLAFVTIAPRVNTERLGAFSPREVIAQFSTRFRASGKYATRAANIALAAARVDGVILLPGDRISFNRVVGERSEANGFQDSWQIMDGEFVRGVGGGTCQVSSTLHAAALAAGLDVIQAYPHSRPLAYIAKGLDATVAWPFVDLELENPWPIPLAIQALVENGTLTFRVLGESKLGRVKLSSEVKETFPFPRLVEVDSSVKRGTYERKQDGIPGFTIQRTRHITPVGAASRRDVRTTRYRPTPELYLVAPDFDLTELPPLPEGAEGYTAVPSEHDAETPAALGGLG